MKYRALPPLSLEAAFNLHSVMRYQIEEGGEKKEGERERERDGDRRESRAAAARKKAHFIISARHNLAFGT